MGTESRTIWAASWCIFAGIASVFAVAILSGFHPRNTYDLGEESAILEWPEIKFPRSSTINVHVATKLFPSAATESEDWGTIFLDCKHGTEQSPINIVSSESMNTTRLRWDYYESNFLHVAEMSEPFVGRYLAVNARNKPCLIHQGICFLLEEIAIHSPSENAIDGRHYEIEIQLKHVAPGPKYAILSIMVTKGEPDAGSSVVSQIARIMEQAYSSSLGRSLGQYIDLRAVKSSISSRANRYYYYNGSLTSPPCQQDVPWFVLMDPITAHPYHVDELAQYSSPSRPLQPLNGRSIYAVTTAPYLSTPDMPQHHHDAAIFFTQPCRFQSPCPIIYAPAARSVPYVPHSADGTATDDERWPYWWPQHPRPRRPDNDEYDWPQSRLSPTAPEPQDVPVPPAAVEPISPQETSPSQQDSEGQVQVAQAPTESPLPPPLAASTATQPPIEETGQEPPLATVEAPPRSPPIAAGPAPPEPDDEVVTVPAWPVTPRERSGTAGNDGYGYDEPVGEGSDSDVHEMGGDGGMEWHSAREWSSASSKWSQPVHAMTAMSVALALGIAMCSR